MQEYFNYLVARPHKQARNPSFITGQYLWKELYYLAVEVLKRGKLLNNEIGRSYFHAWSSYVLQFFSWVFSLEKFFTLKYGNYKYQ